MGCNHTKLAMHLWGNFDACLYLCCTCTQGNRLVADFKEWQEAQSRKADEQYKCRVSAWHEFSPGRCASKWVRVNLKKPSAVLA